MTSSNKTFPSYLVWLILIIYFLDTMNLQKLFACFAIFAICVLSITDARSLKKRSPQDEEGGEEGEIDWCAGLPNPAWLNFFAFKTWCDDGTVGAKAPAAEDAPPPAE